MSEVRNGLPMRYVKSGRGGVVIVNSTFSIPGSVNKGQERRPVQLDEMLFSKEVVMGIGCAGDPQSCEYAALK